MVKYYISYICLIIFILGHEALARGEEQARHGRRDEAREDDGPPAPPLGGEVVGERADERAREEPGDGPGHVVQGGQGVAHAEVPHVGRAVRPDEAPEDLDAQLRQSHEDELPEGPHLGGLALRGLLPGVLARGGEREGLLRHRQGGAWARRCECGHGACEDLRLPLGFPKTRSIDHAIDLHLDPKSEQRLRTSARAQPKRDPLSLSAYPCVSKRRRVYFELRLRHASLSLKLRTLKRTCSTRVERTFPLVFP